MYWWLNHSVHGLADERQHQFIFAPLKDSRARARRIDRMKLRFTPSS